MKWLNTLVDSLITSKPEGELVVSSGVSPSGKYHLGTLREILTAEVIARELRRRGRAVRHIHLVDDHDVFRKVPADVPADFSVHLGKPLCDVPSPDGTDRSYADYFVADLEAITKRLNLDMEIVRAHQKYRDGFFVSAIEKALQNAGTIRTILEEITGRSLDDSYSPIQVIENGYLKNRVFESIDTSTKTITYRAANDTLQTANYEHGDVKLSWRIDWPARWWLLGVDVEPFGRDHATKGGSYDSGEAIARQVFSIEPPRPVPYHFINKAGETKKMSKSAGNVVTAIQLLDILPAEVLWYFMLRMNPDRQLFFDEGETLMRLFDDFAQLLSQADRSEADQQLVDLCMYGIDQVTVSNIPFTHLVASYQASLKDADKTLEVIERTEYQATAKSDADIIRRELGFIDSWLTHSAPDDVRFELRQDIDTTEFTDEETKFLHALADAIAQAPAEADGEWFHKTIYDFKETLTLEPKQMFGVLYRVVIGKTSGPRAGWFLSILPREWLISRLRLEA